VRCPAKSPDSRVDTDESEDLDAMVVDAINYTFSFPDSKVRAARTPHTHHRQTSHQKELRTARHSASLVKDMKYPASKMVGGMCKSYEMKQEHYPTAA